MTKRAAFIECVSMVTPKLFSITSNALLIAWVISIARDMPGEVNWALTKCIANATASSAGSSTPNVAFASPSAASPTASSSGYS